MATSKEYKELIRKKYIKIRKNIDDKKLKSEIIYNKVIALEEYKSSKIVAIYKNLDSEVDTTSIINYSLENGKIVVLPRVIDNELKFYRINSLQDKFEKSKFGVEEPLDNKDNLINSENIDLVIIPGLCFDLNKNRLGFGKGYYDRFLYGIKYRNIAICFEEQIMKNDYLPITDNDVKVKKIITDQNIYF